MANSAAIVDHLRASKVPFALIGAAAMSARGFPRQTLDEDFLTTDRSVLSPEFWKGFENAEVRKGDSDDPLAGVVRFRNPAVDIVVGREKWKTEIIEHAENMSVGGVMMPVVTVSDLIVLKLDAGGHRDVSDIHLMLASGISTAAVEDILPRLTTEAGELWRRIQVS